MSTMLEQAIVDAKALKEAAIKNAESTLIEKYADNIRDAVDSLLEQEEEITEAEEDLGMDLENNLVLYGPDLTDFDSVYIAKFESFKKR